MALIHCPEPDTHDGRESRLVPIDPNLQLPFVYSTLIQQPADFWDEETAISTCFQEGVLDFL